MSACAHACVRPRVRAPPTPPCHAPTAPRRDPTHPTPSFTPPPPLNTAFETFFIVGLIVLIIILPINCTGNQVDKLMDAGVSAYTPLGCGCVGAGVGVRLGVGVWGGDGGEGRGHEDSSCARTPPARAPHACPPPPRPPP